MGRVWRLARNPVFWYLAMFYIGSTVLAGAYVEMSHVIDRGKRYTAGIKCFKELRAENASSYEEHLMGIIHCDSVALGFNDE